MNTVRWLESNPEYHRTWKRNNPEKVDKYKKKFNAEYKKKWSQSNKEKTNASAKLWRKNNPEKVRLMRSRYRKKNIEKFRSYARKRYKANPEKVSAPIRAWQKANPEKVNAWAKAWKKNNPEYLKLWKKANPDKVTKYKLKEREKKVLMGWKPMERGYAQACLLRVNEYRKDHPDATWKDIYANVENHYCSYASMTSSLSRVVFCD